jgi:hypothetical protein
VRWIGMGTDWARLRYSSPPDCQSVVRAFHLVKPYHPGSWSFTACNDSAQLQDRVTRPREPIHLVTPHSVSKQVRIPPLVSSSAHDAFHAWKLNRGDQ